MKPRYIKVKHCRACLSKRVLDLGIKKDFYLLNLDQTVNLNYAICQDCRFIFHREYVGDHFLNLYYEKSPMLRRKDPTPLEIDQYERQSSFLSKHLKLEKLKVLEIGAHTGNFLVYLKNKYACAIYFDELSEEAKKILLSQEGLKDFKALPKKEKMDLVIIRHTLEHIFDLDGFLNYVKSILDPNGSLFIEVPDWSFWDDHTDPLIFEHHNQFNTFNLLSLLNRMGWQCEALEKSIHFSDPATPNRIQRILARPLETSQSGQEDIIDAFHEFYSRYYDVGNQAINQLLKRTASKKRIALYPASHQTFMALHETNLLKANVVGMFDIDPKKHGKKVKGVEIYPAEQLKIVQPGLILLLTGGAFEYEIKDYFKTLGLSGEVVSLSQLLKM